MVSWKEAVARAVPWAVFCLGLFLALQPMFVSGLREVPGDLGDTRLVHWTLEHAHRYLSLDPDHRELWDPPIFYPARNVAAFTDTMVTLLPLYSPWRWLGIGPVTSFQLWLVGVFGLNFLAFYALSRRVLELGRWPSTAAAYLFAFGSVRMINIGHPQLVPGFFLVLAVFAFARILWPVEGASASVRRWWIGIFFLSWALQLWSAVYPAFFLALVGGLTGLVALIHPGFRRRARAVLREERWTLLAAAGLTLLVVLPLVQHYGWTAETLGERPWRSHERNVPRWQSWFLMGADNWLFGDIQLSRRVLSQGDYLRGSAHSNGLGIVTLCVVLGGFALRRKHPIVPILVGGVGLTILATTMLPGGFSVWRILYEHLPGASAIRVPGRIGLVSLIPASIGFAFFYQHLQSWRARWALVPLLFAATVAEHRHLMPHFDREVNARRIASVEKALGPECGVFFVSTLHRHPEREIHEDAMWASMSTGIPTINGRYGNFPAGWRLFEVNRRPGNEARRQQIEDFLGNWLGANCLDPAEVCWIEVEPFLRKGKRIRGPGEEIGQCGGS